MNINNRLSLRLTRHDRPYRTLTMFAIVIIGLVLIGALVALPLVELGLILELAVQMEYAHINKGENAVEKPFFTSDNRYSLRLSSPHA